MTKVQDVEEHEHSSIENSKVRANTCTSKRKEITNIWFRCRFGFRLRFEFGFGSHFQWHFFPPVSTILSPSVSFSVFSTAELFYNFPSQFVIHLHNVLMYALEFPDLSIITCEQFTRPILFGVKLLRELHRNHYI